jgi:hypothetical protein
MATVRRVEDGIDRAILAKFRLATHSVLRQRELPVGATAIKRRRAIWPWIAIIGAILVVMIKAGQAGARGSRGGPEVALGLALLAGAVVLVGRWIITIRPARRRIQQSRAPFAYEVLADDRRLPIVLLRSFQAESEVASGVPPFRKRIEEVLVSAAKPFGPAIAIGAPEDNLPELGAARAYVPGDNEWTNVALEWIRSARLIIMIAGRTPGLAWELERIIEHGHVRKTLVICPRPRVLGPGIPPSKDAPYLFASRIIRAIGSRQEIAPADLDGVIAMFPGRDGELILLRDASYTARSYRLAVEQAIWELFCRGQEAEIARAIGESARQPA